MANVSGWYDPVCYQFYFAAIDDTEISQTLLEAYRQFAEELAPYYKQWLSKGGRLMGNLGSRWQSRIQMIYNEDDFDRHQDSLTEYTGGSCSVSLVPGKVLSCFASPARSIPKAWRDSISHYTDPKKWEMIDKAEQQEWLYQMMNCPTDDLRGIYFPKRCFIPNDIPFKLSLECDSMQGTLVYIDKVLEDMVQSDSRSGIGQIQYLHKLYVSIPRYILDSMDQAFPLQCVWKNRLTVLCEEFESSVGYMKMDACELRESSPALTGNGNFLLGFSQYLPDVAWAMCLTKHQIETLGGLEYLRSIQLFHSIEILSNEHVYLQLTPDIAFTTSSQASGLWAVIAPHLRTTPYNSNCISDVTMSFRIGLERDQMQMEDYGRYRILFNDRGIVP